MVYHVSITHHTAQAMDRVGFERLSKAGCFVYGYLTPLKQLYYVGIAKVHLRPFKPHTCPVPSDHQNIIVLKAGLTWEEACEWECRYIDHYGRLSHGTGTLLNIRDGGQGYGHITEEEKEYKRQFSKAMWQSPKADKIRESIALATQKQSFKENVSKAMKDVLSDPLVRTLIGAKTKKSWESSDYRKKVLTAQKLSYLRPEVKARLSDGAKRKWSNDEQRLNQSKRIRENRSEEVKKNAALCNLTVEEYMALPKTTRFRLKAKAQAK